ncbi:hypothetical protein CEUSTIGMA_g5169.t1 [Chlamydomonas eustigma]|uniref:Peptidase S8/S53 domain-containing protein n=1 Tax=Chlamydomonas eustigma TaxID=1157962 RepID=A0A250X3U7_9CHLO|nr:hypothetical protein CEUSTIGMA_g5169.t1 [Chlamydomonas eustigma]|eukprot:GAX77726.1 hypothetical protein CEUSTIGMA_g5169.t1 [Chlamydomonas eustigma]
MLHVKLKCYTSINSSLFGYVASFLVFIGFFLTSASMNNVEIHMRSMFYSHSMKISRTKVSSDLPQVADAREILPLEIPERMSDSWGSLKDARVYLVSFHDNSDRVRIKHFLDENDALLCSYLPPLTWVVATTPSIASKASTLKGVRVMEYSSEFKLAPEWQPILDALNPKPSLAKTKSLRRKLLNSFSEGKLTDTVLDHLSKESERGQSPKAVLLVSFPPGLISTAESIHLGTKERNRNWDLPLAAAYDWKGPLESALNASGPFCRPRLRPSAVGLKVAVCLQDIFAAVLWLSVQPLVHFISPVTRSTVTNIYASLISQTGGLFGNSELDPTALAFTPFTRMGLDGTGQVIGIADTGLYLDSCFFFDSQDPLTASKAVPYNRTGVLTIFASPSHRKLVQYYGYQNLYDETGHGTHVSGSSGGSPIMPSNVTSFLYDPHTGRGMAPGSKVAFFDIYNGNPELALAPPDNLVNDLYEIQYAAGCRVHSDSWGTSMTNSYQDMSRQLDMFLWTHPDFVSVFAAGNDGANSFSTKTLFDELGLVEGGCVQVPANAKNVIAVGSVFNYVPPGPGSPLIATFTALDASGGILGSVNVTVTVSIDFGNAAPLLGKVIVVEVWEPYLGCSAPAITSKYEGKVVIMGRGNCTFSKKATVATAAKALAVFIINNQTATVTPGVNPTGLTIPMEAVGLSDGTSILSLMGVSIPSSSSITVNTALNPPIQGSSLTIQYSVLPTPWVYQDVPSYSSYGPTPDGRIKPDILAPGDSLASCFRTGPAVGVMDNCSMGRLSGTSMSTPIVAGAAAITRQYFQNGFYPSGSSRSHNKYQTPTGMLIKAVLLAGASQIQGNITLIKTPAEYVDTSTLLRFSGFGRLDLTSSLPLLGNVYASPTWNLQVVDRVPIKEGQNHSYTVMASGGPIVIVLAWYDYPGDINAATALVNDLDLTARVSSLGYGVYLNQTIYLGNGPSTGGGEADRVNTVERIRLNNVSAAATITITVTASLIHSTYLDSSREQLYAVAVLGGIQGTIQSPYNPASGLPHNLSPPEAPVEPPFYPELIEIPPPHRHHRHRRRRPPVPSSDFD